MWYKFNLPTVGNPGCIQIPALNLASAVSQYCPSGIPPRVPDSEADFPHSHSNTFRYPIRSSIPYCRRNSIPHGRRSNSRRDPRSSSPRGMRSSTRRYLQSSNQGCLPWRPICLGELLTLVVGSSTASADCRLPKVCQLIRMPCWWFLAPRWSFWRFHVELREKLQTENEN